MFDCPHCGAALKVIPHRSKADIEFGTPCETKESGAWRKNIDKDPSLKAMARLADISDKQDKTKIPPRKKPNFFQRNWDSLRVGLIITIVGGFILALILAMLSC